MGMNKTKASATTLSGLEIHLGSLRLKNPVMAASGTFGYGEEYEGIVPFENLGAFITKGLSFSPCQGNPPPRLAETSAGLLNAIGLENVGLETFIKEKLPFLRQVSCPVLINIFGRTADEYADLAARVGSLEGIAGIEINVSCPNMKKGGVIFASDPKPVYEVVSRTRRATSSWVMVKLSPNVTNIVKIARAAEEAGADAVSLINTVTGMAIDVASRRPVLGNITGGLSGPAIKPLGLRMVWQVAQAVRIPVVGMGGIISTEDALEYFIAGATAVQIGSAHFADPLASVKIVAGLGRYVKDQGLSGISSIVGSLKVQ